MGRGGRQGKRMVEKEASGKAVMERGSENYASAYPACAFSYWSFHLQSLCSVAIFNSFFTSTRTCSARHDVWSFADIANLSVLRCMSSCATAVNLTLLCTRRYLRFKSYSFVRFHSLTACNTRDTHPERKHTSAHVFALSQNVQEALSVVRGSVLNQHRRLRWESTDVPKSSLHKSLFRSSSPLRAFSQEKVFFVYANTERTARYVQKRGSNK